MTKRHPPTDTTNNNDNNATGSSTEGTKKPKTKDSDNNNNDKTSPPTRAYLGALDFCPQDDDSVDLVRERFGVTPEQAQGLVQLAQSLKVDDPGVFVSFRSGEDIRTHLQHTAAGRPCDPGANGDQALQNLKQWVRDQVPPAKQDSIVLAGPHGMSIGNLSSKEFTDLQMTLSFTPTAPGTLPAWVTQMLSQGHSLGAVVAVFGTGVGQASMSKSPSNVFRD